MRAEIVARLLRLNHEFYQTFAGSFSETRGRLQPGILHALDDLPESARVLDLGCGNGLLARELTRRCHRGTYIGVDRSSALLEEARRGEWPSTIRFQAVDLASPRWTGSLEGPFDSVFAFAVLHHLPGEALRTKVIEGVRSLLASDGRFVLSVWNFMASDRLRGRILPWTTIDMNDEDLEPGDFLLDWRRGGYGLRYVHSFPEGELIALAQMTGFKVLTTYYSDGEGGRLGLYQAWKRNA